MGARGRRVLPADRANDPKGCRWCGLRVCGIRPTIRRPANRTRDAVGTRSARPNIGWRIFRPIGGPSSDGAAIPSVRSAGPSAARRGGWRDLVAWEADHRRPLYERPAVLTRAEIAEWFGAPNLQLLCGPCHTAKCVRETMTRAAVRRALAEAAP